MSTVVLARKYRPRNFAQMVGQDHVVQALSHALAQNRLHHAYLFTGTRGIGKTTVSRILAKSLNCIGADGTGGVTAEPCGVCPTCTAIDADRYLDYTEMDAASNRGIEEARELIERASYKPSIGRFKVFMIDEAHQLTKDAFNALLKTLEEPPEYLKFVLATTDPEKMLPTVLSRCLQFNLRPMSPHTVQAHLQRVLQAEGVVHEEAALRVLGRAARGSMRDALSLTDQAIAFSGGQVLEAGVRSMLGAVDRSHGLALAHALAARDGAAVMQRVAMLREHGMSASGLLEDMASLLQNVAVAQAAPTALEGDEAERADALALAASLAPDETQLLYSIVLRGRGELALMSDDYGALTMVLLRFLAFAPAGDLGRAKVPAVNVVERPVAAPVPVSLPVPLPVPVPVLLPAATQKSTSTPVAAARVASAKPAAPAPASAPAPAPSSTPSRLSEQPPPWMDDVPPEEEDAPPPRSAALRVAEPPALRVPATVAEATTVPELALVKTALGDVWFAHVQQLREGNLVSGLVRELAQQAELLEKQGEGEASVWVLRVERESLRNEGFVAKLSQALQAVCGHAVNLLVQAGAVADSPARREAAARAERQAVAEATIQNDPLVREVLAQVKSARIVPGSIKPD